MKSLDKLGHRVIELNELYCEVLFTIQYNNLPIDRDYGKTIIGFLLIYCHLQREQNDSTTVITQHSEVVNIELKVVDINRAIPN
jgi:hypothetical protein